MVLLALPSAATAHAAQSPRPDPASATSGGMGGWPRSVLTSPPRVLRGLVRTPEEDRDTDPAGFSYYALAPDGRGGYWPSCAPLRVGINYGTLSAVGRSRLLDALRHALDEAQGATGQAFIIAGESTTTMPWVTPNWWEGTAGEGFDVLVGPAAADGLPVLTGALAVSGMTSHTEEDGVPVFDVGGTLVDIRLLEGPVWGSRVLDRGRIVTVDQDYVAEVLLHETGHLLGLGHTDSPDQVMGPSRSGPVPTFQNGDITGIRSAQRAHGCEVAPPQRATWQG